MLYLDDDGYCIALVQHKIKNTSKIVFKITKDNRAYIGVYLGKTTENNKFKDDNKNVGSGTYKISCYGFLYSHSNKK